MEKGVLYLIATPIGNLEDITLRAVRMLKEVDIIAAEDTRRTLKLLNHFNIKKPLISYYEHNKAGRGGYLAEKLLSGKNIALVSDAGSPGISDPGEDMVRLAIDNGIEVTMVPGACAAVMGVVLSGLPSGRFVFEGFLPVNRRVRKERLSSLKNEARTMVFYEAPHKLQRTLKDIYDMLGDRRIILARELTKKFEEIIRCNVGEALERFTLNPPRGEFVVVLEGRQEESDSIKHEQPIDKTMLRDRLDACMEQGLDRKEAMKKLAEELGVSKREVYNLLIKK